MIHRRSFITGLVSLVAAPAIVRAGSLMPVKSVLIAAPNMTATEVRQAMIDFAERLASPPNLLDLIDWDACVKDLERINSVPARWAASR